MAEATYRIIPAASGFKVEIQRPGEATMVAEFTSEADAKGWMAEHKRITAINDRQTPIAPPRLREV